MKRNQIFNTSAHIELSSKKMNKPVTIKKTKNSWKQMVTSLNKLLAFNLNTNSYF